MFYLKEIYLRSLYFLLLTVFIFFIFYINKNTIIYLIIIPFIFYNNNTIKYFIYTHPTELLYTISIFLLLLTMLTVLPYIIWVLLDFNKTGLYFTENYWLKKLLNYFILFSFTINIYIYFNFFPIFWNFFESWNSFNGNNLKFYLELNFKNYLNYLINFNILMNLSVVFILSTQFFMLQLGILYFYKVKKILILINILIATLLSTPEVIVQLCFFLFLCFFLENIGFFMILLLKINKAVN